MKLRRLLLLGLLVSSATIFAFSPWGTELLGRLRGEPTYQGRCASSWRQEALRWDIVFTVSGKFGTVRARVRSIPSWQRWLGFEHSSRWSQEELPLLSGEAEALEVLQVLLRDPDRNIRPIAAEGLGEIGPPARAAWPQLFDALSENDWEIRNEIENALFRIDHDRAMKAKLGHGRWWRTGF